MSNKYNQYYKHQKSEEQITNNPEETTEQELDTTAQVVENEQQNDVIGSENIQQPEDTTLDAPAELLEGHVSNCIKLNIRKEPNINAAILCEVPLNTLVIIDPEKSNDEWLSVVTNAGEKGIDGFCMAKYVNIKQ